MKTQSLTSISTLGVEVIKSIEHAYGIVIKSIQIAGAGSGNSNYLIGTNLGDCILSLIEEQSFEEVEQMVSSLEWLRRHGYATSKLVSTRYKKNIIDIGGKPAFLKEFLEGEVCWDLNEAQLHQLGSSIASLHNLPSPDFLPSNIYYEQDQFSDVLNLGLDCKYESWVKSSLERIQIQSHNNLPRGLIHSDVFCDNVLFDGERLVAIIDFELACNYFLVFDLAMAIVGVCVVDGTISIAKVQSLVSGYESTRKLFDCEKDALQRLTEYAAIMTSVWRYWRYRYYQPGLPKENSYREMVDVAKQIKLIEANEFRKLIS